MKVNHRTFSGGGYKFKNFEAKPSNKVIEFSPTSDLTRVGIEATDGISAYDVLKTLGITSFNGPDYAVLPTEGDIEASQVKDIIINAVSAEPYNLSAEAIIKKIWRKHTG